MTSACVNGGPGLLGRIHRINVSGGGVPKLPVPEASVTAEGIVGDLHAETRYHGGPTKAVSLFSLEVIERLRGEGHPIGPGTTGENLTVEGLDWRRVLPGARLTFEGGVVLEVTVYSVPCWKIAGSFLSGNSLRIDGERHPGESRVCARVVTGGTLREGERVRLEEAAPPPAPSSGA